jgi:hypothetical protein
LDFGWFRQHDTPLTVSAVFYPAFPRPSIVIVFRKLRGHENQDSDRRLAIECGAGLRQDHSRFEGEVSAERSIKDEGRKKEVRVVRSRTGKYSNGDFNDAQKRFLQRPSDLDGLGFKWVVLAKASPSAPEPASGK